MIANLFITISILSVSLQGWHDFWQGLTVISLAIAFIAGFGANRTSKRMAKAQESEIRGQAAKMLSLSTKLEEQRGETARANERAELARKETAEIFRKLGRRYIASEEFASFVESMKSQPKPDLLYVARDEPESADDARYANEIGRMLSAAGIKCKVLDGRAWYPDPNASPDGRMTSVWPKVPGVRLELKTALTRMDWSEGLIAAFDGAGILLRGPMASMHPQFLTDNGGIIVVGPKPVEEFEPPWHPDES